MNRLCSILLLFLLMGVFLSGCFKQEGLMFDSPPVVDDDDPAPGVDGTILYEANTTGPAGQGLIAKVFNTAGDTALVFGDFLPGGEVNIRSLAYAKMDHDTVMHLFFEETGLLLSGIALNLKSGRKLNTLLSFEDYLSYSCVMSLLSAGWTEGLADVQWRWRVDKSADLPVTVPVYIRDECLVLRPLTETGWSAELREILGVVYTRLNNLIYVDPAIFRGADIVQLQQLLSQACTAGLIRATEAPAAAPFYPDEAFYQLGTRDNPCLDHNGLMTRFRNTLDGEGDLIFSEVQGGPPPYSYAVDEFSFQNIPEIPGPFDPNRPYLLMVRDGNGCISSRIGYLGRPVQDACSIVCGKTWAPYEATFVQEDGLPVYEAECDLLDGGCRHQATATCDDGTLVSFSDFTFSLEDFQLTFGNTGKVTLTNHFRYSNQRQLNGETCLLEAAGERTEQASAVYFWYGRTPQLLLLYDQQDIKGRIFIEGPNDLRFERYDPEERVTLRIRLHVE